MVSRSIEKMPKDLNASFFSLLGIIFFFFLSGCSMTRASSPTIAYSFEGPPLEIIGEYGDIPFEGVMERRTMVGVGTITIQSSDKKHSFQCKANIDIEPSEKGRIRGALVCSGDQVIAFTLRNLGPDQGVGIGRSVDKEQMMTFFYHPSKEEAMRRYPEVKKDFALARKKLGK